MRYSIAKEHPWKGRRENVFPDKNLRKVRKEVEKANIRVAYNDRGTSNLRQIAATLGVSADYLVRDYNLKPPDIIGYATDAGRLVEIYSACDQRTMREDSQFCKVRAQKNVAGAGELV